MDECGASIEAQIGAKIHQRNVEAYNNCMKQILNEKGKAMSIETKKHAPIVYKIYTDIKENHIGKANAICGKDLSAKHGITPRKLRDIVHEIRDDETLTHLILTCNKGYYVPTKEEGAKDINRIMNQACSLFKIAHKLAKKAELDGQMKLRLGEYFKPFVESYGEVQYDG